MSGDQGKMSFLEHLEELRARLIRCALAVVGGTIVCWFFREDILAFLEAPLFEAWSQVEGLPPPQPLNFAGMLEPFIAYLKLSAVGGVFVASPVILYNLWRFVSPGLYAKERKIALPFVLVSTLLFVGGSLAAYTVVFPIGFRFFLEFAAGAEVDTVETEVRAAAATPVQRPEPDPVAAIDETPLPDAGSSRETDAGTAGVDAGTGAGADAGVGEEGDGGPETEADAGPPPAPAVPKLPPPSPDPVPAELEQPGEPGQVAGPEGEISWYEAVVYKLVKANCRELEAEAGPSGGAVVRFLWHERECGPMPELVYVKRGDTRLAEASWSDPVLLEGGRVAREFFDSESLGENEGYQVGFSSAGKERSKLAPVLMVKDYLSFAIRLLLAFGLIFELPVLISFLAIAGIVNYRQLLRFSRWFLLLAVVLGAILTPPDVITQVLLAIPLVVLYFISVLVAYLFGPKPDES